MKAPGRRFDIRTPGGKVSGYWDHATQTVATRRGGAWITGPAETMDQARDWLRALVMAPRTVPTQPSSPVELPF